MENKVYAGVIQGVKRIVLLCLLVAVLSLGAFADAASVDKGNEIAKKTFDLKRADDLQSIVNMVLIDKNGGRKTRKLLMLSKEGPAGKDSFIEFLEPADVKGTRFLTNGHQEGDDEQRLYLPALRKVRRISSSSKKGKFMGSDLFYYDLEDRDFEDGTYKYIKDDTIDGKEFFVIEVTPKDKEAPYARTMVWVSKENYFIYKTEAYAQKTGKLLKTMIIAETKVVDGIIIPLKTVVENHKDRHTTLLQVTEVKVNTGIAEEIFTIQNLEK